MSLNLILLTFKCQLQFSSWVQAKDPVADPYKHVPLCQIQKESFSSTGHLEGRKSRARYSNKVKGQTKYTSILCVRSHWKRCCMPLPNGACTHNCSLEIHPEWTWMHMQPLISINCNWKVSRVGNLRRSDALGMTASWTWTVTGIVVISEFGACFYRHVRFQS